MESFSVPAVNNTAFPDDLTLGLSKFVEPDITADVVNCNTALYDRHDALAPSLLMVPTQDKPTVMASQLQREMIEAGHEESTEVDQEKLLEDGNLDQFSPTDEVELLSRDDPHASTAEGAEEMGGTFDILTSVRDDAEVETHVEAEMEEPVVYSQTKEDEGESQPEEDPAPGSQSDGAGPQEENDREPDSEQESTEGPSPHSQAEDDNDETPGEEDEERTSECGKEYISRRAHRSEGGVVPVGEAGGDSADGSDMGKECKDLSCLLFPRALPENNVW